MLKIRTNRKLKSMNLIVKKNDKNKEMFKHTAL